MIENDCDKCKDTREIQCEKCGGSGDKFCHHCNDSGVTGPEQRTCPHCIEYKRCDECNGDGWIPCPEC